MEAYRLVVAFNAMVDNPTIVDCNQDPQNYSFEAIQELRTNLITEETIELHKAALDLYKSVLNDLPFTVKVSKRAEVIKELCDLLYVVYGAGYDLGITPKEIDENFRRVHESNLSKFVDGVPLRNESGKVIKGPNYKKPEVWQE